MTESEILSNVDHISEKFLSFLELTEWDVRYLNGLKKLNTKTLELAWCNDLLPFCTIKCKDHLYGLSAKYVIIDAKARNVLMIFCLSHEKCNNITGRGVSKMVTLCDPNSLDNLSKYIEKKVNMSDYELALKMRFPNVLASLIIKYFGTNDIRQLLQCIVKKIQYSFGEKVDEIKNLLEHNAYYNAAPKIPFLKDDDISIYESFDPSIDPLNNSLIISRAEPNLKFRPLYLLFSNELGKKISIQRAMEREMEQVSVPLKTLQVEDEIFEIYCRLIYSYANGHSLGFTVFCTSNSRLNIIIHGHESYEASKNSQYQFSMLDSTWQEKILSALE
jgi:hypothetical protein